MQKSKSSTSGRVKGKPAPKLTKKAGASSSQSSEVQNKKTAEPPKPEAITCSLKQIAKVLLEDSTGKIKDSGRWPLLVDSAGNATTFLRYRDSNCLCTANSNDMQPETIRKALIGSIRFGKPFLIDMLDTDMYNFMEKSFNEISPNLMQDVMSKKVLEEEEYLKLVTEDDGNLYEPQNFDRVNDFMFVVATKRDPPPDDLLALMLPVKVEG